MTTGDLFGRKYILNVGDIEIRDLRVTFKVEKTLTRQGNTLEIVIYNLNESHRRAIQETPLDVVLQAGYVNRLESIFIGQATLVTSTRNGPDWLTKLQASDKVEALRTTKINASFAPGATAGAAIKQMADKAKIGIGNSLKEIGTKVFAKGATFTGVIGDEIDKIVGSVGKSFSVQDGSLQVITPTDPIGEDIVSLAADSGLIGSPEVGEKGVVKIRSLIQQKLRPGSRLLLKSIAIEGYFRVEKTTYAGDTHGQAWYADVEAKPL